MGQLVDQLGDAPRQLRAGIADAEAHRVAQADLDRQLLGHLLAHLHQPVHERQDEPVDVGARDVLQVAARPDAGVERGLRPPRSSESMHSLRLRNFSLWKMW